MSYVYIFACIYIYIYIYAFVQHKTRNVTMREGEEILRVGEIESCDICKEKAEVEQAK